ncbi:MAG: hypothetical protein ACLQGP_12220 [Isosphaeraceae bacterium]
MGETLLVPVRVDALWVNNSQLVVGATADFRRLPYNDGSRDVNPDVANLSENVVCQPFQDQTLELKPGIHLHWHLPWGLTTRRQTPRGAEFPAVPDTWLVVPWRMTDKERTPDEAWIVESSYLYPAGKGDDSGSITFPVPGGNTAQRVRPFRYLGRKVPLAVYNPNPPSESEYLEGLTAVGHGEPTFAAFYPNCLSVFGFHGEHPKLPEANTGYDVFGWYRNSECDPLVQFPRDFRSGRDPRETGDKELAAAIKSTFGWSFPSDAGQPVPQRLLCYGRVLFDPSGPVKESDAFAARDTQVVLASTGTEALSVYLARKVKCDGITTTDAEHLLEALQLSSYLGSRQLDVHAKLAESRHEKSFQSVGGGSLWGVRRETSRHDSVADARSSSSPQPAELSLTKPLSNALNKLNIAQQRYDQALDAIVSMRRRLFADWYKYLVCAHPSEDGLEDYPDVDEIRDFIRTQDIEPLEKTIREAGELEVRVDQDGRISATSRADGGSPTDGSTQADDLATLINELQKCLDSTNRAMSDLQVDVRYVTRRVPAPRYWAPREPVVLLVGPAVRRAWRPGRPATRDIEDPGNASPADGKPAATSDESCKVTSNFDLETQTKSIQPANFIALVDTSSDFGLNRWEAQPWDPFLLQWEVEILPIGDGGNLQPDTGAYSPNFITDNFELPPGPELKVKSDRGGFQRTADIYTGTSILTSQAHLHLLEQLTAYVKTCDATDGLMNASLKHISDPKFACLSQALGGLNQALLMRRQTRQLEVDDPLAFDDERGFIEDVRRAVGRESLSAPQPFWAFNPIRTGGLRLLRLRLVDHFGRPKDLDLNEVWTTSEREIQDQRDLIRLPPRLAQPARLSLRWLSADPDSAQEMNDHPDTSPIHGWLLPNNLDGSLMVYQADGKALGYIDEDANWQPVPGSDKIRDPTLLAVVNDFIGNSDKFRKILRRLEDALEQIDPESFLHHPDLALLMGRPIAVARIALGLELQGLPAVHMGWTHLRMDLRRAARDTDDFTRVRFPIHLGEYAQFNDGLVGYWIEKDGYLDGDTFHSPQMDLDAAKDSAPLTLSIHDPTKFLTVLLDPRGAIHATSGVLPTKSIRIPPEQFAAALKSIEVLFLTTPLITGVGAIDIPLPDEPGYEWAWAAQPPAPIRRIDPKSVFARPQEIREGWLQLRPAPPPAGQP